MKGNICVYFNEQFIANLEECITQANIETHSSNVAKYARLIAENCDTSYSPDLVEFCGRYHDVGKSYITLQYIGVLEKNTRYERDSFEMKCLREHALMGVPILWINAKNCGIKPSDTDFQILEQAVAFHHENLDGTGYFGLSADKIPEIAQIIAVADRFSAGIEKRSQSPEKTDDFVLDELSNEAVMGKQVNQIYVNALAKGLGYGEDSEIS